MSKLDDVIFCAAFIILYLDILHKAYMNDSRPPFSLHQSMTIILSI